MNDESKGERVTRTRCRTCNEAVGSDAPTFPFCSERCQRADLGKWFNEEYRISRDVKDSDLETVD